MFFRPCWGTCEPSPECPGKTRSALRRQHAAPAVFPTSGKSQYSQLPSLMFGGVTLVVPLLIALMNNQVDYPRSRGVPATFKPGTRHDLLTIRQDRPREMLDCGDVSGVC